MLQQRAKRLWRALLFRSGSMAPTAPRSVVLVGLLSVLLSGCASKQRGYPATTPPVSSSDSTRIEDPVQLLRSRSPGLLVSRTADGWIAIQLMHAPTSANASGEALILLDDVPFRAGPGGTLTGVNPYDIESIRVLTKPEDVGIYGLRGANGVIVITTKKPGR
jgi:TonB-dependent SusC/RagA subfamily outer membrane receptor